jgi:hypothetical protein
MKIAIDSKERKESIVSPPQRSFRITSNRRIGNEEKDVEVSCLMECFKTLLAQRYHLQVAASSIQKISGFCHSI